MNAESVSGGYLCIDNYGTKSNMYWSIGQMLVAIIAMWFVDYYEYTAFIYIFPTGLFIYGLVKLILCFKGHEIIFKMNRVSISKTVNGTIKYNLPIIDIEYVDVYADGYKLKSKDGEYHVEQWLLNFDGELAFKALDGIDGLSLIDNTNGSVSGD